MKRKEYRWKCVTQANDASCIGNKRGMARRAKRHSAKVMRQKLRRNTDGEQNVDH